MNLPIFPFAFITFFLTAFHPLFAKGILVPEKALQSAIAQTLGIPEQALTEEVVNEKLVRLEANGYEIRDLNGLQHAKNLEYLVLRDNLISDLSPIQGLKKLQKLDLSGNKLSNLDTLVPLSGFNSRQEANLLQQKLQSQSIDETEKANLILQLSQAREFASRGPSSLKILNLSGNLLLGLSGIEHFTNLVHLDVSNNNLTDVHGLGKLKKLVRFIAYDNQLGRSEPYVDQNRNKVFDLGEPFTDISGNGLRDTDPLAEIQGLSSLTDLHLYNNRLQSLDSLKDLPNLRTLLLSGNLINKLSNLGSFERLEQLSLANNDLCELAGLEKLQNLRRLNLDENHICDLRPIRGLNRLHTLNIHSNLLLELSNIEELSNLVFVGLSRNFLEDISSLLLLPKLSNVVLSHNYLDLDNEKNKKNLSTLKNKGVYISFAGQKSPTPQPFSLIESLLGHTESSHHLAEFLRAKGFNGLNEFVSSQPFNESDMEELMTRWESSLKKSGNRQDLYYPN